MLVVDVPNLQQVLVPNDVPGVEGAEADSLIRHAIKNPIGTPPLSQIARGRRDAVIIINDITRPCPTKPMVEALLEQLEAAGMPKHKVLLVVATGNHRPATHSELEMMLGPELAGSLEVISHVCTDDDNMSFLGDTEGGVPIYINKRVVERDLKIATGLITPHHSAGFSGGRKSILPGVSGIRTLNKHHSYPIRPYEASMGWYSDDNAFHVESLRAARMLGVDFMVNTIDNERRQIVRCVAGDIDLAHRSGVETCRKIWEVPINAKADVVITSPGGFPRDIDMHQSQKAVSTAELAARKGAVIILVAECSDGIGKFGNWLKDAKTPEEVIERYKREGYTKEASAKAFMYARAIVKHTLILVCSGVSSDTLQQMFIVPSPSVESAIQKALEIRGKDASFVVIPHASDIIPTSTG